MKDQKLYKPNLQIDRGSDTGKLPPQAIDAEEAVLGALMIDKNAIGLVVDILVVDSFYKESHRVIYNAIFSLYREHEPIDFITIISKLRSTGELEFTGGAVFITNLTGKVNSSANIEHHALIIKQMYIKRELINECGKLMRDSFDDSSDAFDLVEQAQKATLTIGGQLTKSRIKDFNSIIAETARIIDVITLSGSKIIGIKSKYEGLNNVIKGYQKQRLYVVAARPGMGKTMLILNELFYMVFIEKKSIILYSIEMSAFQITIRLLSIASQIDHERIASGDMTAEEYKEYHKAIGLLNAHAHLIKVVANNIDINQIRSDCRACKMSKIGLDAVFVDYLQLMTPATKGRQREQEISEISRGLKGVANEYEIPVIAVSQLSRAVETRGGDKRPQLSDLRESGAIEQDADNIHFCYRAEYYKIMQDEAGNSTRGKMTVIIAKNRDGRTADIELGYYPRVMTIENPNKNDSAFLIPENTNAF